MIIVLAFFELEQEAIERANGYAKEMAAKTNQEEGCIDYSFGWDLANPNRLLLQERWESTSALDAHFATEHMRRFRQQLVSLSILDARATRYQVNGEADIPMKSVTES